MASARDGRYCRNLLVVRAAVRARILHGAGETPMALESGVRTTQLLHHGHLHVGLNRLGERNRGGLALSEPIPRNTAQDARDHRGCVNGRRVLAGKLQHLETKMVSTGACRYFYTRHCCACYQGGDGHRTACQGKCKRCIMQPRPLTLARVVHRL